MKAQPRGAHYLCAPQPFRHKLIREIDHILSTLKTLIFGLLKIADCLLNNGNSRYVCEG
jgi:hypothetical protein